MSRRNLQITPSNVTSTGKVSFKSGNPVLQFIIGEADMNLIGSSVRLCGQYRVRGNSTDTDDIPQNASQIRTSEALGVFASMEQLVIKSQATHQVIEEIKSYNRFMGSYLPVTSSHEDNLTHLSQQTLVLPNYNAHKISVTDAPNGNTTAGGMTQGNSFCCHLPCGLFNGKVPIPLAPNSQGGLGGILVEIHLSPDANVLFSQNGTTTDMADAFYELSDVYLTAEAVVGDGSSSPAGTFEFNSISSYFTTFNAKNAVINFNLGLSRVLGVFGNITSASHINTVTANGLANNNPVNSDYDRAAIDQLFFLRGGEKFPIEYNIDTIHRATPTNRNVDSQVAMEYMNAIQKFSSIGRTMAGPRTLANYSTTFNTPTGSMNERINGGGVMGVGVSYDVISGEGVDFSSVNFGINMDVGLTTDNPQALYLFVHSKQTVAFSGNGIQIIR